MSSVQRPQSQEEEQPFPFSMNTSLTPFRISETASPIPPSTKPTEHQKTVLRGKRVVLLDGGKFLVRGLRKLCEQVNSGFCDSLRKLQNLGFFFHCECSDGNAHFLLQRRAAA